MSRTGEIHLSAISSVFPQKRTTNSSLASCEKGGRRLPALAALGRPRPRPLPTPRLGQPLRFECNHGRVTVIKVNAITVPGDSGDELARRFAARAGAVDNQDGFEGFELLKPTDERTTWLVITRWRDEAAFEAWVNSPAFTHGHRSAGQPESPRPSNEGADGAGAAGGHPAGPVGIHSELWSYEIAGGSRGKTS